MAGGEVGSVYITVRAITDKVSGDIEKAFAGVNTGSISKSGEGVAKAFNDSISKGVNTNLFTKVGNALSNFGGEAGSAREELFSLTRTGYLTGTSLTTLLGAASALIGGLGGIAGAAGGAAPALMGLLGAVVSLKAGIAVGQLAFEGIAGAVQSAISQSQSYRMTLAQLTKQHQDLAFAAENAGNTEKRAALDLEKARNNLIRMQDLPPNSLVRREAMQSYKEAETAYRQAKARRLDAEKESKNPLAFKTPKADPYAGLSPAQKAFAEWLVSIQGKFQDLKDAAASGFLPILKSNLEDIIKTTLPTFQKGVHDIAVGLGGLTTNLTAAVTDPGNVKLLGEVMHNIASDLPTIGTILGNVYGSFLTILKASHPLVTDFLNFLKTKTKTLSDWLKAKDASGELETFFKRSEKIMQDLGTIIGNTLGGIGGIIEANFQPGSGGDIMLQWLKNVTGGWTNLDSTVDKKNALKQYFIDTANNSTKILDAVGALGKQFLILGANQSIGDTFKAMADPKAVTAMGNLGKKLADAGPSLGKLVADIVKFIDKMTDTKAITNFFDTLDTAVKNVTDFISIPAVSNALTFLGRIHGVIFGIIALSKIAGFGFKYMGETFGAITGPAVGVLKKLSAIGQADAPFVLGGKFKKAFEDIYLNGAYAVDGIKKVFSGIGTYVVESILPIIETAAAAISEAFLAITPVGWIVIAVAAITAFFVWFFTQTDAGKKMWADLTKFFADAWNNTVKFFQDAWNNAMAFLKPAIDVVVNIFKTGVDIIRGVVQVIGAIFTIIFVLIGDVVQVVWDGIVAGFKAVAAFLKPILDAIGAFFKPIFTAIGKVVSTVWDGMQAGFKAFVNWIKPAIDPILGFFKNVFNGISSFVKTIINGMIGFAEGFVNFFIDGLNTIIAGINKIKLDIPPLLQGVFGGQKTLGFHIDPVAKLKLPRLAQGGTVMPSTGGSLVNVAEAGRPERIEPLDANGLSNRDKALINFLSNGTAGKSIQMNIYPSAGMSEQDLAAAVSRQLAFELRRGGM